MKNYKGITLMALVVTIVVLLILAGVSISMLAGENGIIAQAQDTKNETRGSEIKERVNLAINNNKISEYSNLSVKKETKQDVIDKLKAEGKLTDEDIKDILDDNKVTIGKVEIDFSGLEGIILPLPKNGVISQITGEYENKEDGIVIYIMKDADADGTIDTPDWTNVNKMHTTYDQFVWVPVPNPVAVNDAELEKMLNNEQYPMAVAIEGSDSNGNQNYRGVLYDFSEATDVEGNKYVSITAKNWPEDSIGYREPSALTTYDNSTYLPQINGILNTSYSDSASFGVELQEQFNYMVKKVIQNKGFFVGRYETSGMSDSTTEVYTNSNEIKVNVIKGIKKDINYITWYRMYAQQKLYSKLAIGNIESSMIWGSQWDQLMIWMKNVENKKKGSYYIVNASLMGNYGSIDVTGSSEEYKVNNVYDLAGNVIEWTLESFNTSERTRRGADLNNSFCTGKRMNIGGNSGLPFFNGPVNGSRLALY